MAKSVNVRPYVRGNKFVIGYHRTDPRDKLPEGPHIVNVPKDIAEFIKKKCSPIELKGISSLEELDFKKSLKSKTLSASDAKYLDNLVNNDNSKTSGFYFWTPKQIVIDSQNEFYRKYPVMKKAAYLHEIGHHVWHNSGLLDMFDKIEYKAIWAKEMVSNYASLDADEGFAEAYSFYKYGVLKENEYPHTYRFMSKRF